MNDIEKAFGFLSKYLAKLRCMFDISDSKAFMLEYGRYCHFCQIENYPQASKKVFYEKYMEVFLK